MIGTIGLMGLINDRSDSFYGIDLDNGPKLIGTAYFE